jgi:hypothetical protein
VHWPSYDRTTWGIILSFITLLLAVPLSVLANLATPTIQNWWAERSKASLENRIRKLEAELEFLNQCPPLPDVKREILIASSRLGRMLMFAVYWAVLAGMVIATVIISRVPHYPPSTHPLRVVVIAIAITVVFLLMLVFGDYYAQESARFVEKRSTAYRLYLVATIGVLIDKLAKRK